MAVHEITHPLIAHKLGLMRNANISSKDFRELASEVGNLLTYEATRTLPRQKNYCGANFARRPRYA